MKSHIIGLFVGFGIIYYAFMYTGNDSTTYFDVMSVIIVFGGTLSVSIMTNGLMNTLKILSLFFKVFSSEKYNNISITKELVEVARKHHMGTLNAGSIAEGKYHPFVMDGIRLLHNKFDADQISNIMSNMMNERQEDNEKKVHVVEALAKYPPAFGMVGTIIGLVAVLKEINSPTTMGSIGPSMAVALVTTLYGILLSNYFFQPIADNLQARSQSDLKIRQLIAEGTILISQGHDPVYTREALLSCLAPGERKKFAKAPGTSSALEKEAA